MDVHHHNFVHLIQEMGMVGVEMTRLDAAEASAGNLSFFVRQLGGLLPDFIDRERLALPLAVPALSDGWVVITGTGRRLRDVAMAPGANVCVLHVEPGGTHAVRYAAQAVRPTSELNSHLAIHADQVERRGLDFHAVVHAQPPYITYLSHIDRYADTLRLNRSLLRWEPETVLMFPDGIGMLLFQAPGSPEQMQVTVEGLRHHKAVVWQRHGMVTRSDASLQKAADLIEYAETAARYEYLNLQAGAPASGLTLEELQRVCAAYNVDAPILCD